MRALVGEQMGPDGKVEAASEAPKWALASVHTAVALQGHGGEKTLATQRAREPPLFLVAEAVLH